jgi:hypothetical protein
MVGSNIKATAMLPNNAHLLLIGTFFLSNYRNYFEGYQGIFHKLATASLSKVSSRLKID